MKIRIGRRYILRNGARVKVAGMRHVPAKINGKPDFYLYFCGYFLGGEEQLVSWELSGRYSPIRNATNGLDIVKAGK